MVMRGNQNKKAWSSGLSLVLSDHEKARLKPELHAFFSE
jgi:hypothetical protein